MSEEESSAKSSLLSPEQIAGFHNDGYLVLSNVLDEDALQQVVAAGEAIIASTATPGTYFSTIERGAMYTREAFRSIAINSKLPQIAAELMQLDPTTQNMRVLRDVFLAKHIANNDTCGFHVDDQSFWPESFLSTAAENSGKDQYGINAWIALDDMPKKFEGSMAVARGSHRASWRWEGYEAIGQDRTRHGPSKDELFELFKRAHIGGTCQGIANNRPDLNAELEKTAEIFDLKRGDVIFATRLLFHRTMPVTKEGQAELEQQGKENLMRYSIRYVPGTARLPDGFSTEYSLLDNEKNLGRTLNEVADDASNQRWYPQVWPTLQSVNENATLLIDDSKIKELKAKEMEMFAELRSSLGMTA